MAGLGWAVPGTVEVEELTRCFLFMFEIIELGMISIGRDLEVYIWFGKLVLRSEMLPPFTTDEYQMINKIYRAFMIVLLCKRNG